MLMHDENHLFEDMDTRKVLNEALYLRTLNDLSTLNVPIGEPGHWSSLPWEPPLGWPVSARCDHLDYLLTSD